MNEQIERLGGQWGTAAGTVSVLCECGDAGCLEPIEIAAADYEAVRSVSAQFVVKPGHIARGERFVRTLGECVVVEKIGRSAAAATRLDPRLVPPA